METGIDWNAVNFDLPDDVTTIVFDGDNEIRCATLPKLIEHLTLGTPMFHQFYQDFFLTYRSFCTGPHEVLQGFIARMKTSSQKEVQLRVLQCIHLWSQRFWDDFTRDPELLIVCIEWMGGITANEGFDPKLVHFTGIVKQKILKKKEEGPSTRIRCPAPIPRPSYFREGVGDYHIIDCDPEEIARQLTLAHWPLWTAIKMPELLGLGWTKRNKHERSSNVLRYIERFNLVSQWVGATILSEERLKGRARVMRKFMQVAWHLRNVNNYDGLMAIISGLNQGSVYRLRDTLEKSLKGMKFAKGVTNFEDLVLLSESQSSYRRLREAIRNSSPPCIPYLGMYLTDLTFIEEGSGGYDWDGMINFGKRRRTANVLKEVLLFQAGDGYDFAPIPSMQEKLKSESFDSEVIEEVEKWELSYFIEPRHGRPRLARPQYYIDKEAKLAAKKEEESKERNEQQK